MTATSVNIYLSVNKFLFVSCVEDTHLAGRREGRTYPSTSPG